GCSFFSAGATTTEATGTGVTVTLAVPFTSSQAAVMVTLPGANAVTSPAEETSATAVSLEDHVIGLGTMVPPPPRGVAVSCMASPTITELLAGAMATDMTRGAGMGVVLSEGRPNGAGLVGGSGTASSLRRAVPRRASSIISSRIGSS